MHSNAFKCIQMYSNVFKCIQTNSKELKCIKMYSKLSNLFKFLKITSDQLNKTHFNCTSYRFVLQKQLAFNKTPF